MRQQLMWKNRVIQVDLWERNSLTVKLTEGEESRFCKLGANLSGGTGQLAMADGSFLTYFVSASAHGFWVTLAGETFFFEKAKTSAAIDPDHAGFAAPMPGKIVSVAVEPGAKVKAGAVLVIVEAMKMEHRVNAPTAGTVKAIHVTENQLVSQGFVLLDFVSAV